MSTHMTTFILLAIFVFTDFFFYIHWNRLAAYLRKHATVSSSAYLIMASKVANNAWNDSTACAACINVRMETRGRAPDLIHMSVTQKATVNPRGGSFHQDFPTYLICLSSLRYQFPDYQTSHPSPNFQMQMIPDFHNHLEIQMSLDNSLSIHQDSLGQTSIFSTKVLIQTLEAKVEIQANQSLFLMATNTNLQLLETNNLHSPNNLPL